MKRFFILSVLLFFALYAYSQSAIAPSLGDGSTGNPYQIATWQNLYWLSQNSTQWDQHYIQTADIYMPENIVTWDNGKGWTPIGSFATSFTGTYNGDNFLISNIHINRPDESRLGLFGAISAVNGDKKLSNIRLFNVVITGRYILGGLIGYFGGNGYLEECSVIEVDITGTGVDENAIVQIGGLAGYLDASSASRSFATGYIYNNSGRRIGGFVGDFYSNGRSIEDCYSDVRVIGGDFSNEIGGFIGSISGGTVRRCYSVGYVYASPSATKKGGFSGERVGGYSQFNFWDKDTSQMATNPSVSVNGRTTTQMKTLTNYTMEGWTFNESNWKILEGVEYPFLRGLPVSEAPTLVAGKYEIDTAGKLYWISEDTGRWGLNYLQTANIDLTVTRDWFDGRGWRRIGYYASESDISPFTGSYDGGGFKLIGLTLNRFTNTQGFFGMLGDTAVISNVGIVSANINGAAVVGALVGWNNGATISNCYSSGRVTAYSLAGGLIGDNRGNVNNCYSRAIVKGFDIVGGFVGYNASRTISRSFSSGDVFGTNQTGGFLGRNDDGGGVENSYSLSNVTRLSGDMTSLGGFTSTPENIFSSYSTGWVKDIDGLVIPGNGFGSNFYEIQVQNCYWDTETSLTTTSYGGTGRSTANMKSEVFVDWDWITTWERIGYNYPRLRTNPDETLPVTLSSFTAISLASNTVSIMWTTESESNLLGYHILRNTSPDLQSSVRINREIINAYNQSETSSYSFTDLETENNTVYYYWLFTAEMDGSSEYFGPVSIKTNEYFTDTLIMPMTTRLYGAYPNPFNPSTNISFDITEKSNVCIVIFNSKGQKIKTLINSELSPGRHNLVWNGKNDENKPVSTGVYFYKMIAQDYEKINSMLLLK